MGDIEELCKRVILIDRGKLFFDGPLAEVVDRFAAHKVLTLTFAQETRASFEALGEVLEVTPVSVRVRVARSRVAEICREALSTWSVTDLAVQESSVEEVIRQLFDAGARQRDHAGE
jgi:ABC-2 type transport system ATP-binding protein